MAEARRPTVLIANPSPDVYGSDLQMLEAVSALVEDGWRAIVAMPSRGALVDLIHERGAEVMIIPFPVVRRANASASGVVGLGLDALRTVGRLTRRLRSVRPDALIVNTVTIPWWLLAARLAGVPAACYVHEAETTDGRLVRFALNAPLMLARVIIVISTAARNATAQSAPGLGRKCRLVYNGVPQPPATPTKKPVGDGECRLAIVARLSPRKAPDVALEATALLRSRGRNVVLDVCGTPFAGYEWFEQQLRSRAAAPDLAGSVEFSGYVSPIWPTLERAHILVAPSLREPFGNAVVEAQLALRPVVASAALGHLETVEDGVTGLLVEPGNAEAMAAAVERLLDDPSLAEAIAERARHNALEHFSVERYGREIRDVVGGLAAARRPRAGRR
jgi:glycosyltransferase involved in cell wall biosynthesis